MVGKQRFTSMIEHSFYTSLIQTPRASNTPKTVASLFFFHADIPVDLSREGIGDLHLHVFMIDKTTNGWLQKRPKVPAPKT